MPRLWMHKPLWYLALWFILVFACAQLTPYFSNDYRYMLMEGTDNPIASLSDIFVSQYRHYFDWGGRTVAHVIAQFILYIGKPWQPLITALCYCTLVLFIYYLGFGIRPTLRKLKLMPLIFITLMLWMCLRVWGEVVINVVSSCNYMFTTTLILIFVLPFRLSFTPDPVKDSWLSVLLMFIGGILAGWCNENTGFALVVCIGLFNLYRLYKRNLTLWQAAGGIGLLLGYMILVFSPGNEVRFEFMKSLGYDASEHIKVVFNILGLSLLTQHVLLISFLMLLHRVRSSFLQYADEAHYKACWWLFALGALSLLIMLASPNFPARSAFPFTAFVTASAVGLYKLVADHCGMMLNPKPRAVLLTLAFIFTITSAGNTVYGYAVAHADQKVRDAQIAQELKEGRIDLEVSPMRVENSKYLFIGDVRHKTYHWVNLIVSKYYGVSTISRICNPPARSVHLDFIPFTEVGTPVCQAK